MAEEDPEDPTLSAVVTILPKDKRTTSTPESGVPLSEDLRAIGLAKSRLTSAGFEVHAPFGVKFSIGAKQSVFEQYFGTPVTVDDSQLIRVVTTKDGQYELPLGQLPDDLRGLIESVAFSPPPEWAKPTTGAGS